MKIGMNLIKYKSFFVANSNVRKELLLNTTVWGLYPCSLVHAMSQDNFVLHSSSRNVGKVSVIRNFTGCIVLACVAHMECEKNNRFEYVDEKY